MMYVCLMSKETYVLFCSVLLNYPRYVVTVIV